MDTSDGEYSDGYGSSSEASMVAEREISEFILEVFEEQEDAFYFPVTTQKDARAFVKALHIKGLEYDSICQEIGEFEHNFVSWRKGLGRPGVGNRIIEMINKPLEEVLFSDDDDEEEEEEEEEDKAVKKDKVVCSRVNELRKEPAITTTAKSSPQPKEKQEDITDSWVKQVSSKTKEVEEMKKESSSEPEVNGSEDTDDTSGEDEEEEEPKTEEEDVSEEEDEKEVTSETPKVDATTESGVEQTPSAKQSEDNAKDKQTEEQVNHNEEKKAVEDEVDFTTTKGRKETVSATQQQVDRDLISSDSSSVVETEISENYDSDLDIEGVDPSSDTALLAKRVASLKAELSDGPGFVFAFTDSPSYAREQRLKIGASRFPNKRLEQAMHFNINIKLATAVAVSSRQKALKETLTKLKRYKIDGQEDWFKGPLDKILAVVNDTASNFTENASEC